MKRPRIRSRRITTISPWMGIVAREVEFSRGTPTQTFHAVEQADYVSIVAMTGNGKIPIVRQYRPAIEEFSWELPAGMVDPGETPAECCRRELLEETGLTACAVHDLGENSPCTGRLSNRIHSFFVEAGERVAAFRPEPGLTVKLVSPAEIARLIRAGAFVSQLHLGALLLAELHGFLSLPRPASPNCRPQAEAGAGAAQGESDPVCRSNSRRCYAVRSWKRAMRPRARAARGSSGMTCDPFAEGRVFSPEPSDPLVVHPGRRHQERQQPGQIVIASGGRVEDADALLQQRGAGDQPQPRIGLRAYRDTQQDEDGGNVERRHRSPLGGTCEPAPDLADRARDVLACEIESDQLGERGEIGGRLHDQRGGMGGGGGE